MNLNRNLKKYKAEHTLRYAWVDEELERDFIQGLIKKWLPNAPTRQNLLPDIVSELQKSELLKN